VVSRGLFGARQPGGPGSGRAAPLPFYVTTDVAITKVVVRSTATGEIVAVVPVTPGQTTGNLVAPALATGEDGTFYLATFQRGMRPGDRPVACRVRVMHGPPVAGPGVKATAAAYLGSGRAPSDSVLRMPRRTASIR
jgi:hypothetical protein